MDYTENIEIEGRIIKYRFEAAWSGNWYVIEENYDGPSDKWRWGYGDTKERALSNMVEKMTEYIIEVNPEYLKD